jgi:GT2 family glycosyltransferase
MEGVRRLVPADLLPPPAAAGQKSATASFLTVIVCTHERPHYLATCLDALDAGRLQQDVADEANWTVLVVDSASSAAAAAEIAALTAAHGADLLRVEEPGLSLARNAGLAAVHTPWVAYIDDDARVAPDWARAIAAIVARLPPRAAALGGPIVAAWEAPCPSWWPAELVPALTVLSWGRPGRVGDGSLPPHVEPYGANMVFRTAALRAVGGFPLQLGRIGAKLLSGEEAWVMRALREAGHEIHYDPAISVTHSIQAGRLTPRWLLERQYWSGVSEAIATARLDGHPTAAIKGLRMVLHAGLRAPLAIWPARSPAMIRQRCALAFASGYLRGLAAALRRNG